jgi:two-component system sensor kinase
MLQALTCPCGYRWTLETESTSDLTGRPLRCPKCGGLIDTVSLRGGAEHGQDHETFDVFQTRAPSRAGPGLEKQIAGYHILGELGRGGMGIVYRAYSEKLERVVALKTLRAMNPDALQRFKREFRVLADVTHPNLVNLYELVSDGETWFFSMELLEGMNFLDYTRKGCARRPDADGAAAGSRSSHGLAPQRLLRIRRGMAQLASAVAAMHRAEVLHRDIKSSNIVVTAEERLVLLDFGLAADLSGAEGWLSANTNIVGTVAYMSPEQADGRAVTHSSDWYSVGVVLYLALVGRMPFQGSPLEILTDKQTREPVPPRELVDGVPEDLDQLCCGLLHKDPTRRPLADEILRTLSSQVDPGLSGLLLASPDAESLPLVGRQRELETLNECYQNMERGRPMAALVHGRSGMGKTVLVQEFLDRVRTHPQAVVLAGRCYEQESVPFKALDSLIDALCHHLQRLSGEQADSLMPRDIQALVKVFPVLGGVEAAYSASRRTLTITDQQELRRRALVALREILSRMGDRHPVVLFVDDLQWGDVDSAVMLGDLLRPPDPPLLLFVGAYREEDADTSPFLRAFRTAHQQALHPFALRDLPVQPLEPGDARQLGMMLLGSSDTRAAAWAERIARESGGSPFFARELARFLQTGGRSGILADVGLEGMLRTRLDELPDDARRLLETIAVAGRPTSESELLRAAELEADAPAVLAQLRAGHLIRVTRVEDERLVETYHDRIREAAVAGLAAPALREVHARLAQVIRASLGPAAADWQKLLELEPGQGHPAAADDVDQSDWQRVFDLAYHLDAAGRPDQAMGYALAAAEQARRQHSLEIAEQQYEIARRGCEGAERLTRYRILEGLGDVLMLRGRYEPAQEMFQDAQALIVQDASARRAQIAGRLGELAFKRGDMQAARQSIEAALRLMGRFVPRRNVTFVALAVWETGVQLLHTLWPRWFIGRRAAAPTPDERVLIRLYSRLAYVYWFLAGKAPCLWTHLRNLNLSETYPPTTELAQAWAEHGPVMTLVPFYGRAIKYAERSLAVREQLGDTWGRDKSLHYAGIVLYAASRFDDCIDRCREAISLLDRTGDFWEMNMARYQLAASLYRQGRLREAREEALRMYHSGVQLGDVQASGLSVDILSKASCGKIPAGITQAELARMNGDDAQTASQVLQAEGVRLLAARRFAEAAETLERAYQVARRAGITNTYVVPCLPWLATALRQAADQNAAGDPAQRHALLRRARRAARSGVRRARKFQNDLPHALRELALLSAGGRARKLLRDSLEVARQQGARYEYAQSLLALGQWEQNLGLPSAAQHVAQAQSELNAILSDAEETTIAQPDDLSQLDDNLSRERSRES